MPQVTEAMIRMKAYELWEANGRPLGEQEKHWFAAEALLLDTVRSLPQTKKGLPNGLRQINN